jgi:hypothetical protein
VRVYRLPELPLEAEGFVSLGVASVEPRRITSVYQWTLRSDDGGRHLFLHAPGEIELPVPAGARWFSGAFGIEAGAYTGEGRTDGAEFVVEAVDAAGTATVLWRHSLAPLTDPRHRGRQRFRVELPGGAVTAVRVRTEPGTAGNGNWDWTYLAELRFE